MTATIRYSVAPSFFLVPTWEVSAEIPIALGLFTKRWSVWTIRRREGSDPHWALKMAVEHGRIPPGVEVNIYPHGRWGEYVPKATA